jgi:hypothetical protein
MNSNRFSVIQDLREKLDNYQELTERLNSMNNSWDSGDPHEMAGSDPGLQYEMEVKLESLWTDIREGALHIISQPWS